MKIMTLEEVIQSGNYELIDVREPMELMMDGEIEYRKADGLCMALIAIRNTPRSSRTKILYSNHFDLFFCKEGVRQRGLPFETISDQMNDHKPAAL